MLISQFAWKLMSTLIFAPHIYLRLHNTHTHTHTYTHLYRRIHTQTYTHTKNLSHTRHCRTLTHTNTYTNSNREREREGGWEYVYSTVCFARLCVNEQCWSEIIFLLLTLICGKRRDMLLAIEFLSNK